MVFGIDVEALVSGAEPGTRASHGYKSLFETINDPSSQHEQPAGETRGSLFGALVGRTFAKDSDMYSMGKFSMSLPELLEHPKELFLGYAEEHKDPPARHGGEARQLAAAEAHPGEESVVQKTSTSAPRPPLAHASRRPYLTELSKLAMNNNLHSHISSQYLHELQLVDLSILSLQGVSSSCYAAGQGAGFTASFADAAASGATPLLAGHTETLTANYLHRFNWAHTVRVLLATACNALQSSLDTAQQGFAICLAEILTDCDASLVALRRLYIQKIQQRMHGSEGGSMAASPEAAVPSLAEAWLATQQHRLLQWHLLTLIAEEPLLLALKHIKSQASSFWGAGADAGASADIRMDSSSKGQGPSTQPQSATPDSRHIAFALTRHGWSACCVLVGWNLFNRLYERLHLDRLLAEQVVAREVFPDKSTGEGAGGAASGQSPTSIPTPLAHMIVTACLLRRVSVPLLEQLNRQVFQLEAPQPPEQGRSRDAQLTLRDLRMSLAVSPIALLPTNSQQNNSGCELHIASHLLSALTWAQSRITLLTSDVFDTELTGTHSTVTSIESFTSTYYRGAPQQGGSSAENYISALTPLRNPTTVAMRKSLASAGAGDAGAGAGDEDDDDDDEEEEVGAPRTGQLKSPFKARAALCLPLHTADTEALLLTQTGATQRLSELSMDVKEAVQQWMLSGRVGVTPESESPTVQEWILSTQEIMVASRAHRVRTQTLAVSLIPQPGLPRTEKLEANQRQQAEAALALEKEQRQGIVRSVTHMELDIDQNLFEEARAQILAKFERQENELSTRRFVAQWRLKRMAVVPMARAALRTLIESETAALFAESNYKKKLLTQRMLAARIPPKINASGEPLSPSLKAPAEVLPTTPAQEVPEPETVLSTVKKAPRIKRNPADESTASEQQERASVKVVQAPGGASTVDLTDGSEARALLKEEQVPPEEEGQDTGQQKEHVSNPSDESDPQAAERPSVRVAQAPGGTSSVDMTDGTAERALIAAAAASEAETASAAPLAEPEETQVQNANPSDETMSSAVRASTRVTQEPGGGSTVDLTDGSEERAISAALAAYKQEVKAQAPPEELVEPGANPSVEDEGPFPEHASIHVAQEPWGTSTVDSTDASEARVAAAAAAADEKDELPEEGPAEHVPSKANPSDESEVGAGPKRASTRVAQEPGGTSSVDLTDGSEARAAAAALQAQQAQQKVDEEELALAAKDGDRRDQQKQKLQEQGKQEVTLAEAPLAPSGPSQSVGTVPTQGLESVEPAVEPAVLQLTTGSESKANAEASHEKASTRVNRPPGGRSTMGEVLQGPSTSSVVPWSITDNVGGALEVRRPVRTEPELTAADMDILKTCQSKQLFAPQDAARLLCSDFSMLIHLLGARHGVVQLGEDGLETALELFRPLETLTLRTLVDAVRLQCLVLDQASLHTVINDFSFFEHMNAVNELFLWSTAGDFLMNVSATLVEETMLSRGVGLHARVWAPETLSRAIQGASAHGLRHASLLRYARFELNMPPDASFCDVSHTLSSNDSVIEPPALLLPGLEAFRMHGLETLQVAYDAPWPMGAFITPENMSEIGQVTKRLFEMGHLQALVRLVWSSMRPIRHYWGTSHQHGTQITISTDKKFIRNVQNELNQAFMLAQTAIRSISAYLSDSLSTLQLDLKEKLLLSLKDGCAGVKEAVDSYANTLPKILFCATEAGARASNSTNNSAMARFAAGVSNMLLEARCVLAAVHHISMSAAGDASLLSTPASAAGSGNILTQQRQIRDNFTRLRDDLQTHVQTFAVLRREMSRAARAIPEVDLQARAAQLMLYFDIH